MCAPKLRNKEKHEGVGLVYHPHSRQIWAPKRRSNLKFNPLTRHVRTLPQLRCPGRAFSILPKFTLPRATSARGGSTKKNEWSKCETGYPKAGGGPQGVGSRNTAGG